jgi:hypothetical protein
MYMFAIPTPEIMAGFPCFPMKARLMTSTKMDKKKLMMIGTPMERRSKSILMVEFI